MESLTHFLKFLFKKSLGLLSTISWHFTVADLSKNVFLKILTTLLHRMFENGWRFESGTLGNVFLSKAKFGLSLYHPSIKFSECHTVARNPLKCSPNEDIQQLWKSTSTTQACNTTVAKIRNRYLRFSIISGGNSNFLPKLNSIWSSVQSNDL